MPEGPELCVNSRFVNHVCRGRLFKGKVFKSPVSKCCDINFCSEAYSITSEARGKEMALTLQCTLEPENRLRLLFRFGMSGKFRFSPASELPKHAHLQFFSRTANAAGCDAGAGESKQSPSVLSFVDVRRFGSWRVMPTGWGEDRGPDPMFEYNTFRNQVLQNLEDAVFSKPICEVMLNQTYFNGIGNYLRAEILFRAKIPPFVCARNVLEPLSVETGGEGELQDLLWFCHKVPLEVVELKQKLGRTESTPLTQQDYLAFCQWLQCYEKPGMKNLRDHNGRTMWFKGDTGLMAPKTPKSRKIRKGIAHLPGGLLSKEKAGIMLEDGLIVKKEPETAEDGESMCVVAEEENKQLGSHEAARGRKRARKQVDARAEPKIESDLNGGSPLKRLKRGAIKAENGTSVSPADVKRSKKAINRIQASKKYPAISTVPCRRSTRIKNAKQKM